MPKGFLPNSDAELQAWALNFRDRIVADSGTFGITVSQAESFSGACDAYSNALVDCAPQTRNVISTSVKNAARATLRSQARLLSSIIQGQAHVTDADRINLRLNVRAPWTRIPAPSEAPQIVVSPTLGNRVEVTLSGTIAGKRGKPARVAGAAVMSYVGENPPADAADWKYEGSRGKTTILVQFDPDLPAGTKVWLCAHWMNARLQAGPICPAKGTHLMSDVGFIGLRRVA